jgi:hypothetical protein
MTVTLRKLDEDGQWFSDHPDRAAHIREPRKTLDIEKRTHQTQVLIECEAEFRSLGDHNKDRRRILLWKVPKDNIFYDPRKPAILKVPFLLYGDETVEDRDDILLPILHEIMTDAAK